MKTMTLAFNRSVSLLLILSMISTFFVLPAPARAGMLGNFLCAIRPIAQVAGKIGGAILGASLAGAFCPPLGMIAGAVGGWIAGGIITNYATASLTNVATLAGGAAGAMALAGFGPLGMVGGFFLGAFLGRTLMGILYKADQSTTGGVVFQTEKPSLLQTIKQKLFGGSSGGASSLAPSGVGSAVVVGAGASTEVAVSASQEAPSMDEQIRAAEARYQSAYQSYISATSGGDAAKLQSADAEYKAAYKAYMDLTGKEPK